METRSRAAGQIFYARIDPDPLTTADTPAGAIEPPDQMESTGRSVGCPEHYVATRAPWTAGEATLTVWRRGEPMKV